MQETRIELSRNGLIKFLDYTSTKSLMNPGTVATRRKACETILGILDDAEAADLSKIDLEDVIRRHSIKSAGKFVPATLKGYESHLRGSIKDFFDYAKDPSSWRPPSRKKVSKTTAVKKPKSVSPVSKPKEFEGVEKLPSQPSVHIDFQIHISPESTPEQIDKIFESMSRHFGKGTD